MKISIMINSLLFFEILCIYLKLFDILKFGIVLTNGFLLMVNCYSILLYCIVQNMARECNGRTVCDKKKNTNYVYITACL